MGSCSIYFYFLLKTNTMKQKIETGLAPAAIGPYSQAIKVDNYVYFSGQIPLDPTTMLLISDDFRAQAKQVFSNLAEVCKAAGGSLNAIVKITIYLTDLIHFPIVNEVMVGFFESPYPARTTIQVSALPKEAQIEIDAVMMV
jgi:reactive intermediate/imine deaminase